jgi:hypothetical protein
MKLPSSADLRELPDTVLAQVPEMKGYRYTTVGDKVLRLGEMTAISGGASQATTRWKRFLPASGVWPAVWWPKTAISAGARSGASI